MATTQPARGMRDFLPDEVRRRRFVIRAIAEVYERYGFEPLETPAVENIETLLGKYGEEGNQLIFKILKRGAGAATGEADLALRYDLTVPLARVVAAHRATLPKFFKRYQIQPVWRADRPARGRFREFHQCDVDVLGSRSLVVEAELSAAASEVLQTLGFHDFLWRLNHRQLLAGVLESAGVAPPAHETALVALDKWDKIGRDGVAAELLARGIAPAASERLLALFDDLGEHAEASAAVHNVKVTDRVRAFLGAHESGQRALGEVEQVVALAESSVAAGRLRIDPSLARGLSYYTGAIMEIAVPDLPGSLGGGGRYDHLVGMFLGQEVPACGFSLGLERIILVMTERGMFPEQLTRSAVDVLVTRWSAETSAESLALAEDLRRAGLRVDLYPDADKIGKQLREASARKIPCVVMLGDEERAEGEVSVKDLRTGEQLRVRRSDVAAHIARIVAGLESDE